MASINETDDSAGDLIDLNNRICVSSSNAAAAAAAAAAANTRSSSSSLTYEEQEHLLDVCPPKLEQKLSLSSEDKKKRDNKIKIVLKKEQEDDDNNKNNINDHNNDDNNFSVAAAAAAVALDASDDDDDDDNNLNKNDILVTLGHDKVMPIGKRIDVVSSDTIKRVKDITKNLEPVIENIENIKSEIKFFNTDSNLNLNRDYYRENNTNEDIFDTTSFCSSRDTVDAGVVGNNNSNNNNNNNNNNNKEKKKEEQQQNYYSCCSPSPSSSDDNATAAVPSSYSLEYVSFETEEINNAFNFLTEIEERYENYEDADIDDGINESISSDGPLMKDKDEYQVNNCNNNKLKDSIICSVVNKNLTRPNSSIDYDILTSDSDNQNRNTNSNSNKLKFFKSHSLRGSIKNIKKYRYGNYNDDDEDEDNDDDDDEGKQIILANGRLRRSLQVESNRKSWSEGIKQHQTTVYRPNVIVFDKYSDKINIDYDVPSTSNCCNNRVSQRSSDPSVRTESNNEDHVYVDDIADDEDLNENLSSSSASEVDWSWVEEIESSRLKSIFNDDNNPQQEQEFNSFQYQYQNDKKSNKNKSKELELESALELEVKEKKNNVEVEVEVEVEGVEIEVGIIPTSNSTTVNNSNIIKRMRQPYNMASNSTDSIVMSAAGSIPTAKSLPVPGTGCPTGQPNQISTPNSNTNLHNNHNSTNITNNVNNGNNNGLSWVRASMRRLRHLRLPETDEELRERELSNGVRGTFGVFGAAGTSSSSTFDEANTNSEIIINNHTSAGRNSLPDIALIAPEILAAQTNSGNIVNNHNNSESASVGVHGVHHGGGGVRFLRPSSAPNNLINRNFFATGVNNTNPVATSPGRGRLNVGRSRGINNDELINSRRSSLQSRITSSDTTNSCSTTSSGTSTAPTSPNSSPNATPQHHNNSTNSSANAAATTTAAASRRICERQRVADREDERGEDEEDEDENPLGRWPHALSPALACLGCTLGLFNISRFSILSIQFGANFIVQFLILSLILGIPLFTLQVCLGQRLAAGAVDMWKISPLFQGVGIALLTAQALIGIYSIVGISWMFVYFRDSFITKQDKYQWAEPLSLYRDETKSLHNGTPYKLQETVPDYFSGAVLQRHHLNDSDNGIVTLKFQVAFNLAVVWMIVFVSLSKGLRSYGKVIYVFTLLPVFGTLVLCAKLLGLTPTGSIHQLFPATVWSEFFLNGKSWMAASSEVFLTWGLFGAAAMQIAAHNKHKHLLQRDTSLVVVLTFVVLLLSAFLANTCVQILKHQGYIYTTSSFERISGYTFMHLINQPNHQGQINSPERSMNHASFLVGQRVLRHSADSSNESGYQVLRLATELVPATLAILGSEQVSPFWAVLFYFILILFGIAQQLAIWHCVITGIMAINTKMMKLWETTITFFSCACGYILGLPMATEFGIYVVYYLDYTVGGAWWIMVLYLVQVGAVFAVRGRPHTGEAVVAELFPPTGRCLRHWAGPLLSFTWNVVLPVALMVLSIMIFKNSGFRDLYTYRRINRDYWPVWAKQLGASIQLIPILMIPVVAIIQTCRYLNSGPPDIFDRIQLLYRPSLEPDDAVDPQTQIGGNDTTASIHGNGILPSSTTDIVPLEDPPPKYTPPPSYTTATGARIAKMLRQSFRRSVRRIANVLGESSSNTNSRQRPAIQPPPPDYATVLVEMNNQGIEINPSLARDISIIVTEAGLDVTNDIIHSRIVNNNGSNNFERRRPNTIDRNMRISNIDRNTIVNNNEQQRSHSTMDRNRRSNTNNGSSNLTAADVANLLRSSIRRGGAGAGGGNSRNQQNYQSNSLNRHFSGNSNEPTDAVSVENLVDGAAPISQDSLVLPISNQSGNLVFQHDDDDDDNDEKTVDITENTITVI